MSADTGLARSFRKHLTARGWLDEGDGVVVAVSGGIDSLVLLHLLRFAVGLPGDRLLAAHLDHGMRAASDRDALWVRGVARAWGVRFETERADPPPDTEARARELRYEFLEGARRRATFRWIATAHHADDQAETVLFRILRGTGLRGLRGIPERREPGILRPLLPFWKAEIVKYARERAVRPRVDPTNRDLRFARNVIRHRILPVAEEEVAPRARRALVRLSELAGESERATGALVERALEQVIVAEGRDRIILARDALLAHTPPVRSRLVRRALGRLGLRLDRAGTRTAVEFTRASASGRSIDLPGGIVLAREFDRLVFVRNGGPGASRSLVVGKPGSGQGTFQVGGRRMQATWSPGTSPSAGWIERFSPTQARFPLLFRDWTPGDRIRMSYGSKKLKKVFGEAKVPRSERRSKPVLVDADGSVLWIPGVVRSVEAEPRADEEPFFIGVSDADE